MITGKINYLFHINDHPKAQATIIRDFKDVLTAYYSGHNSWPITVKALLLKMIGTLIDHDLLLHPTKPQKQDTEKAMTAKKAMTYIHQHYGQKLTLDQLARSINLSPQYYCKFFKATFGKTAIEYVNEYRIEKACQLLKQTDGKIIDIALSVGFDNFSYFIRKFKALKNMTPSAYRNSTSSVKD